PLSTGESDRALPATPENALARGDDTRRRQRRERDARRFPAADRLEGRETARQRPPASRLRRAEEHRAGGTDRAREVADAAVVADVERGARQDGGEVGEREVARQRRTDQRSGRGFCRPGHFEDRAAVPPPPVGDRDETADRPPLPPRPR